MPKHYHDKFEPSMADIEFNKYFRMMLEGTEILSENTMTDIDVKDNKVVIKKTETKHIDKKADSGKDIVDKKEIIDKDLDKDQPMDNDTTAKKPDLDLNDMDYDNIPDPPEQKLESDGIKKQRLWELFSTLKGDIEKIINTTNEVNHNLLNADQAIIYNTLIERMQDTYGVIEEYLTKLFLNEEYAALMYKYLLFRNEVILNVKILNKIIQTETDTIA